ncbi:MAG: hypothetical protein KDE27_07490 [Planctomycetes bacterium]|nr:hypothetical protein [Planctomycetota bacterium]
MLMCRRHWFMVPKPIRDRVWLHYRAGQCELNPPPSTEWHAAADEAIAAVAAKERQIVCRCGLVYAASSIGRRTRSRCSECGADLRCSPEAST